MNAIAAALSPMTPPQAGPQNGRGDAARGGEFARCLDQACESEPPEAPEASEEPQRPASKARGARDAAAPRKTEAKPAKEAPREKEDAAAVDSDTAATDPAEAPHDETAAPDLAALLPGWSPPPVAIASTATSVATEEASADGTDALQVAAAATPSALRDDALPRAAAPHETPPPRSAAAPSDNTSTNAAPSSAQLQAAASEKKDTAPGSPAAAVPTSALVAFAASSATSAATAPKAAEPVLPTATVQAPIGTPTFAPSLATQVRWWANDGVQQAQLLLNPAEMGPVAVKIVLDGREARIDFSADLAATRSAIEAALPALAAALDDGGLKLSGGGVHDGSAQRQAAWSAQSVTHRTAANASARDDERSSNAAATRNGPVRGMVDLVA